MIYYSILFVAILFMGSYQCVPLQDKIEFTYRLDDGFPIGEKLFGNIAGVDVDKHSNVIIFHRGSHEWVTTTFDINEIYLPNRNSPIPEETIVTIDPKEKKIVAAWGSNLFFMPHGLSLDLTGENIWLTDVALHQVFKYPIDGSKELIALGTPFVPGNDDSHFCKPTSVADTGDFVFVADGYCNSRVVMFSAQGRYLGEFGQSSDAAYLTNTATVQPTFNIPHKITYAEESKMLCVADRENGRIQCFSFDPKQSRTPEEDRGLLLNGAIKPKFTIADPLFNGRLFSLDYSPLRGGVIVAVSGERPASLYHARKPPLGFVYNVTTGELISKFAPPSGKTFGMAHDLAITGSEAESLYVGDITPVNLWRFSRPVQKHQNSRAVELTKMASTGINQAMSLMRKKEDNFPFLWYIFIFSVFATVLLLIGLSKKLGKRGASNSFSPLYGNAYPTSINSLFGNGMIHRRAAGLRTRPIFNTRFSRAAFFNLFNRNERQQNDFSRIPLEESDNSDDDKSDSDVEEFNINKATQSNNISV